MAEAPARPTEALKNAAAKRNSWRQASRQELVVLALYFTLVILITDALNVRLGVEAMSVVVLLAAVFITGNPFGFFQDWWFLLVGLMLWNMSGPIAAASPFPLHLDFMLRGDRILFLGHDPVVLVQHGLASPTHITWLDWLAFVSYNVHVPEPYVAGYVLWRLNRLVFLQFATAALALLVAGFVIFIVYPAVPPWMASSRFARLPNVYNGFGVVLHRHPLPFHGTPLFYIFHWQGDAVAAFPSEHAAFPVLEMLALTRISRYGWWMSLWVLWVLFVILFLGEHWVTDALAGWTLAVVIFLVVLRLTRPRLAQASL